MTDRQFIDERSLSPERTQHAVIAVATATLFGGAKLMGTAMAVVVGRRGTPFAVSMVLTAYFVGKMVFSPFWGAVADITGRRRLVLLGTTAAATVAILPLSLVGGVWLPIGFRTLYAIFAAGFAPIMLTIVSARGGPTSRGESVGFFNSASAVGTTAAQLAAGALLGLLVPADIFLVIVGVTVVTTAALVFVEDPTPAVPHKPDLGEILAETRRRLLPEAGKRGHLTANGLQWLYVGLALRSMTVLGVMSLIPVYLVQDVGVTELVMGALLAINPATQSIFMYVFGRGTDTIGRKRFITAGMAGSGLFALVAAAAEIPVSTLARIAIAAVAFLTVAVSFSAMRTGAIAFVGDVSPDERESELMGLLSTAKGTGGLAGPPLFGVVATVTSYQTAFAAGSVLALAGAVVVAAGLVEPPLEET